MARYWLADGKHRYIDKCTRCGATNVQASSLYGMCTTCGTRYSAYMKCKRLARDDPSPANTAELARLIEEYKELRRRGNKVPRDIP